MSSQAVEQKKIWFSETSEIPENKKGRKTGPFYENKNLRD
jgi:hypothetical protein